MTIRNVLIINLSIECMIPQQHRCEELSARRKFICVSYIHQNRTGQVQPTRGPRTSIRTRLRAALVHTYMKIGELNLIQRLYLQTISYISSMIEWHVTHYGLLNWIKHKEILYRWARPIRWTLFLKKKIFQLIILGMFRTNNCPSSGGLYKQLTVFHHASCKKSSDWHDTIDTGYGQW